MSNKYNFIKLQRITLRDFSLYKKGGNLFEVNEEINQGVYCLAGANGLGKTTFLNAINYCLTGIVVEPNKEVLSPSEIIKSSKDYTKRYFVGRTQEKYRSSAEIEITFRVKDSYYRIIRGFFDREGLRLLEIFKIDDDKRIPIFTSADQSPIVLNEEYESRLTKDIGFSNFDFFIFYQLYVLTFDENRNMIFWDERAASSALAVAFNSDPEDAEKISDVTRRMEKHESNGRNSRWQATQALNKLKELEQESKKRKPINLHNLEKELKALYKEVEKTERVYNNVKIEHDSMLRKQSILNSEIMVSKNEHTRLFSKYSKPRSKLLDNNNIQYAIKKHQCTLCGSAGIHVVEHIEKNIHKDCCPLCDTPINDNNSDEQFELLKFIEQNDKLISIKNRELEDLIVEMSGKYEQLEKAEFEYQSHRERLEEFTNEYPDISAKGSSGDRNIDSLIHQYQTQYTLADQESKDEYTKRDKLKPIYDNLLTKVESAYKGAELEFVPIFKKLAKSFIGLELNIQPKRSGKNIKLVLELQNTARTESFQLSESQRFFLDIALRMSLAIFLSGENGATILVDTPEGSLDIAYESRVGNMFAEFATFYHQNLFMTANINASQLLVSLAEKCGNEHMKFRRMLDWTDLTDIQKEGEQLFQMVYNRIETALNTQALKNEYTSNSRSLF
jgi:DNA repair exonuclease SbcCD ATPase subunit